MGECSTICPSTWSGSWAPGVTVAVDVGPGLEVHAEAGSLSAIDHLPGVAQDVYDTVMLMTRAMTRLRLKVEPPDVLIQPQIPPGIGIFTGFRHAEAIIACGETAARRAVPEILAALEHGNQQDQ